VKLPGLELLRCELADFLYYNSNRRVYQHVAELFVCCHAMTSFYLTLILTVTGDIAFSSPTVFATPEPAVNLEKYETLF
jgi:hypothetical protein